MSCREHGCDIPPRIPPEPYYQDDRVRIYHGDCREILGFPEIAIIADVVITDPPYGIHHQSGWHSSWKDTEITGDESTDSRDWLITRYDGLPMAIFGTWRIATPVATRAVLVWDKGPERGMGDLSFPWKPSWECIYILGEGWNGPRDEAVLKGYGLATWESKGRRHPHEKPVDLLRHLLQKAPGGVVLDPFMGSGTTLRAAKDLGRYAIGIEIEERYCEIAANRLRQEVLPLETAMGLELNELQEMADLDAAP